MLMLTASLLKSSFNGENIKLCSLKDVSFPEWFPFAGVNGCILHLGQGTVIFERGPEYKHVFFLNTFYSTLKIRSHQKLIVFVPVVAIAEKYDFSHSSTAVIFLAKSSKMLFVTVFS